MDRVVESTYARVFENVPVDVMDIPALWRIGRTAYQAALSAGLDEAARAETVKKALKEALPKYRKPSR